MTNVFEWYEILQSATKRLRSGKRAPPSWYPFGLLLPFEGGGADSWQELMRVVIHETGNWE